MLRRHWRTGPAEIADLRQDVYERVLSGAAKALPLNVPAYVFAVARNHLINKARRRSIVSFDLFADLDSLSWEAEELTPERYALSRDELRRLLAGMEQLPPRCREIVRLRKVEDLSTREIAGHLGIGIDAVEQQIGLGMRALADFMLGGSGKIKRAARRGRPGKRGEA